MILKWKDLLEKLQNLTPEQLDKEAIFEPNRDDGSVYFLTSFLTEEGYWRMLAEEDNNPELLNRQLGDPDQFLLYGFD